MFLSENAMGDTFPLEICSCCPYDFYVDAISLPGSQNRFGPVEVILCKGVSEWCRLWAEAA